MPHSTLPEAYRLGNIPFGISDIGLALRPFIPRPETEYWVHEALKTLPKKRELKILDAFVGSGAIGIALLKNLPNAQVDFIEKNPKLKKQILLNLQKNKILKSRARIITGDILEKIPAKKYHYIFANPPYIDPAKKHAVQKSVLNHEPHEALFAKDHGLYYVKCLVTLAPKYLLPDGKMWIEFGMGQKRSIEQYLRVIPAKAGIQWSFLRDQYERWRVLEISVE